MKNLGCCRLLLVLACGGCHLIFPFDVTGTDAAGPDAAGADATGDGRGDGAPVVDGKGLTDGGPAVPTLVLTGEKNMEGIGSTTIPQGQIPLDHAFVLCSFRTENSEVLHAASCQLDSGGVTIAMGSAANLSIVRWYVVQSAAAWTQRGSERLEATETHKPVTIGAVDRSKTFVLVTSRMSSADYLNDQQRLVAARLTGTTTLELERGEPGPAVDVEWQVVQLDGARVLDGVATVPQGKASATVTIAPVVRSRAFLLFSVMAAPETLGSEDEYGLRGQIVDGTTIELARGETGAQLQVPWFVVELGSGQALHGLGSMGGGAATASPSLGGTVDVARSFPLVSNYLVGSGASNQDDYCVTAFVSGPSTVAIERVDSTYDIFYAWTVVEL